MACNPRVGVRDVPCMTYMRRLLACLAVPALLAAAPASTPVAIVPRPGTPLDQAARALVAQDLAEAVRTGERPLLLVGSARLGAAADRPALFVQLQSPRECGSAGCSTSVYAWTAGRYQRILDSAIGPMSLAASRHRGMADILAGDETYVWTGTAYANSRPAPEVDLRPRLRPRTRATPPR